MATVISKADKQEAAQAQLILQICKFPVDTLVGNPPTDEDLAALYENRLDATRRAQLLSYIASSSVIHQRWVRCVESLAYMEEIDNKVTESSESVVDKPVNNIGKLIDWLSDLLTKKHVFSGGISTVAVLILVLYLLPLQRNIDVDMKIDHTYAEWGGSLASEWSVLPASKKPEPKYSTERSFFSTPKDKTVVQQVLETGFKISMSRVGVSPFKDYGIEITSLSSVTNDEVLGALTTSQYKLIRQIGQLSALAAIQCKIDDSDERISELVPVFSQLREQLSIHPLDNTATLVSVMEANDSSIVCLTAQYVVNLITE